MALLSKLNIEDGKVIYDYHVYQIVDALTYQQTYDLLIKGSVSIGSGSLDPNVILNVSGGMKVVGDSYITATQSNATHNVLYYDTASGKITYGSDSIYVSTSSFNDLVANYNNFTESYYADSQSFNDRFASASAGVTASLQYAGRTPATRNVGGISVGDSLAGYTLETLLQEIIAPYTPPTLSLVSLSPTSSAYNEQNINYAVTFRWAQNVGTTDFVSAQIQYKRAADFVWNNLTTAVTGGSSQKDASATASLNTSGVNNDAVQFRATFVDGESNTSETYSSSFAAYAAPTVLFSGSFTPALTAGGYQVRSVSTAFTGSIGGTFTRNSPNVNLTEYKVARDYNDSNFTDLNALTAISGSGGDISPVLADNGQPTDKSAVRYIGFVKDTQVTAGQYVSLITMFNIYNPVLYGMSSATTVAGVDLGALAEVSHSTRPYTNTSTDKVANDLIFNASSNRFCIAYDSSYGTLEEVFDQGANLNLISNFTTDTKSVTFADGTTKTYRVYLYNLVVYSGTYTINIS